MNKIDEKHTGVKQHEVRVFMASYSYFPENLL